MVDKSIPWTSRKTNRKEDKSLLTPPLLSKLLKRKLSFKDDLNFKGLLVCLPVGYSTKGEGERKTCKNLNKGSCLSQIVIEVALCFWALIGINWHQSVQVLLFYIKLSSCLQYGWCSDTNRKSQNCPYLMLWKTPTPFHLACPSWSEVTLYNTGIYGEFFELFIWHRFCFFFYLCKSGWSRLILIYNLSLKTEVY